MLLNYTILVLYILVMVAIAFYSRKKSSTLDDFFLAGKGLGGWLSAFAYGATYFSSVIFIGYAGTFGQNFGLAAIWIGVGNALIGSMLAWKVLAKRTKVMTTNLKAKTMPQFFEQRYKNKWLKLVSALIIFVFLIPYSASIYQGIGTLFESVMKIDFMWCILIMTAITALYLFFGGYIATALTDFFQGIIMLVGVVVMMFFILAHDNINFDLSPLFESGKGIIPEISGSGNILTSPLFNVIILVLLTSFGVWALPQSIHKFYAVKNDNSIKQGMVISTIFAAVIGCVAYFVGSLTNFFPLVYDQTSGAVVYDQLVPQMILNALPSGFFGLIVVLLLAASMSSLAGISLVSSSAVSIDFYKGYIKKNATDKEINILMKCLCLLFILLSALLAIFKIDAIVTLMGLSWGTIAGCFIGPYVYGLLSKKVTAASCWASLISGLTVTLIGLIFFGIYGGATGGFFNIISVGVKRSPIIGVAAMSMSMIIVPIVSAFTKKVDSETIDKAFAKD